MLTVSHIHKRYSTVVAVDDVSFEARRGEILGLLGPNGAGKTTSIRMVLNIIRPDKGTITYDGSPFTDETRNIIGYLPEERGLYRKNKLLNTIGYFASLRGIAAKEARKRAAYWLKRFDLATYGDRKAEELSKGNQQKVQFIISILHEPALVILDEPFSGLDPINQILLKDILLELKSKGVAVIFSTHQMEHAERLCDSITLINRGKVVLQGALKEVKNRFGRNNIHVEFDGDGSFLATHPSIQTIHRYENFAELELTDGTRPQEILRELSARLDIRKFEMVQPSLNAIFLELVGGKSMKITHKEEIP